MRNVSTLIRSRLLPVFGALTLLVASVPQVALADQLTARSITLGTSRAATATTHQIDFTTAVTANIGSIKFQYCTTASGACTLPSGLSTSAATLSAQNPSGFTLNTTTNGAPYVTKTAVSLPSGTAASFTLSNVTNPTATNTTFYVRITTYTGTDGSTGATDSGTVAASTANMITVNASVDETLTFCTGTSGITSSSCAGATGTAVNLGSLTSSSTGSGTSQIGVSTNAGTGYNITVSGTTLTSGVNTITALNAATTSTQGSSQFGMNLVANTTPTVGAAVAGAGTGSPAAGYNTANNFKFTTGDIVASKASADNFRFYTVSYIANIPATQAAGAYKTDLTYVATANY